MFRWLIFAIFSFLCLGALDAPALADKRVALVIGNSAYKNAPLLPNPRNDARDVAASLKRVGFETIFGVDLDKAGMDEALIRFSREVRSADVALFYYSGHAMQFAGNNYLIPIDANITDEADLRRMTRVDEIVADLQSAKGLRVLVLDSCRNNPLMEEFKRAAGAKRALSLQRGLAKIENSEGMIISYATQAGSTASDGTGRNSPYTAAFLRHIEEPEEIGTIFRRVAADVYETTRRTQLPELSLSVIGEFYLKGRLDITVRPQPPASDPCTAAADHWKSAEALGTLAAFEDHVARFPACAFAGLARSRIAALAAPPASSAKADMRRFDGIWVVKASCESKPPAWPAESYQFTGNVRDGVFHAQRGVEGQPRSMTFDGKIDPDGVAEIAVRGFSGDTERDPIHRPTGTEFRWQVAAKFDATHGVGLRADERTCHFDFSPLKPQSAGPEEHHFDGIWITSVTCEATPDVLGWSVKFVSRVKNSELRGQQGIQGQPGSNDYYGKIESNGDAEIQVTGLTGDSRYSLQHQAPGTPVQWNLTGRFDGSRGNAIKVEGRTCIMDFVKQSDGGGARGGPDAHRFDGVWIMSIACDPAPPAVAAWSNKFLSRVKNSEFRIQTGVGGKPGWTDYHGTIEPDGNLEIRTQGLILDSKLNPNHLPAGTPFQWKAFGRFDEAHGHATRIEGRTCDIDFVKQSESSGDRAVRSVERPLRKR
jgi:uncharacterized caspase-like protein